MILGLIQLQRGMPALAVEAFAKAEELEQILKRLRPGSWMYSDVRNRIEDGFLKSGDYDALANYYKKRLSESPDDLQLQVRLGRILVSVGRLTQRSRCLVEIASRARLLTWKENQLAEARVVAGLVTDATTGEPVRVRMLHDSGIAERLVDPEEDAIGDLQVRPWASLSGQSISFFPLVRRGLGEARFQDSYYAQTDTDGRFELKRLPPGAGSLQVRLGPWEDSPLTSAEGFAVELKPGESLEVTLGGDGAVFTGQVITAVRDQAPLDQNWSLNYLVSRDRGIGPPYPEGFPKLSFDPSGPAETTWSLDPHFNDWVKTRSHHFVKLTPEGKLRVVGMAPGQYDLFLRLYEQPAGCLVETVGERVLPVRVDGDGEIDLGRIVVPCRAGPRVGSEMRSFAFDDATGRKRIVDEMTGRFVLMHVWASWCEPCLESMPDMQATIESLTDRPATFVGLNVDHDADQARALAERKELNWAQNYLARIRQWHASWRSVQCRRTF
jgi:thiol-disulfide isomerase/thioredoxin